ncbi:MAG: RagB/SusD family nutrient uptake outer membrane protein [Bacteroidales bacterium]|nr:RagB/SusD family nutrient uptake outer membrane protein [Bacteroidales bacterium]
MRNIFLIIMSVFVLASCDYLDTRPIQDLSNDELWSHATYGEGLLTRAYANLNTTWDVQSEYYTDNAVPNTPGANILALGGWTLEGNPIGQWDFWYTNIRYLNEFLANGRNLLYSTTDPLRNTTLQRYRIGEAYFLRAWYQWMLLKTYGGYADGSAEALGFPIVTEVLSPADDLNRPRNTYEECVTQIVEDLDSAAAILPVRYTGTDTYTGVRNVGRGSRLAALTLKAQVYLWAASPAYGPSTFELWDRAAKAAYAAIVVSNPTVNNLSSNSSITSNWYRSASTTDFIWIQPAVTSNSLEYSYYPPSLYGAGLCNPSQNFVDAFPARDGYPVTESALYNAADPYANRDPRLPLNVFYNGMTWNSVTVQTYDGGNDAPGGINKQGTRTGYYMRKLLTGSVSLTPGSVSSAERFYVYLHKTDLYLMFAEAANEAYGPADATLGASAYDVMARVRRRAGIDADLGASGNQDPYMVAQRDLGKDAFRTFIRNERRIELAFEGQRFWDIRRWEEPLNHTVRGVQITRNPDTGVLTFQYRDVEEHTFQDYMRYIPVPFNQTLIMSNLKQNSGW